MLCLWYHCTNDSLGIVLHGRKYSLIHPNLKYIYDFPLQRLDLTFQPFYLWHKNNMWRYASKLRGLFRAIPKIGYSCQRHYITWNVSENWRCTLKALLVQHRFQVVVMETNFCKAAHFQVIFLADMQLYIERRVSKNWLIFLLRYIFSISHSSIK